MAKMSKAQARKRLLEARTKLMRIVNECIDTTTSDNNALFKMSADLLKIRNRLK